MAISESTRLDSLEGLGKLRVSFDVDEGGLESLLRETFQQER
jgi:hypothetical protein